MPGGPNSGLALQGNEIMTTDVNEDHNSRIGFGRILCRLFGGRKLTET